MDKAKSWGIDKLSSRENPLVLFTLVTQAVVGAFMVIFLAPQLGLLEFNAQKYPIAFPLSLFALIGLETFALVISTLHLGKPHRFYRSFNNLKYSPVSREVAAVAVAYNLLGAYAVLTGLPQLFTWMPASMLSTLQQTSGWLALIVGPISLYFMHAIYRIKARPYWNHWQVLTSFYGSMLSLGAILAGLFILPLAAMSDESFVGFYAALSMLVATGLLLEMIGLYAHAKYLQKDSGESAAAHIEQATSFGKSYWMRNIIFVIGFAMAVVYSLALVDSLLIWTGLSLLIIAAAVIGRAMFYVLVIPTTMPGAFFWKNPAFEQTAMESGLANMQQVGVQVDKH